MLGAAGHDRPADGPVEQWRVWWAGQQASVAPLAARQGFVVRTSQLGDLGVTRSTARHAVATERWSAPLRGVVCPLDLRDAPDRHALARRRHAVRAAGASLCCPGHVVSCRSAAVLHGLPTLAVPTAAELTAPDAVALGNAVVHRFGAGLRRSDVARWYGVPVTDVARTVVDLARHDPRDGIVAYDAALRAGLVSSARTDAALRAAVGWPGVRQAREVLALGSSSAESPLESLTRWQLHRSGLPVPELQVWIGDHRVDLLLAGRLVVEADGRGKYTDDELWREKRREHALRNAGYEVERVLWSDVLAGWRATERRLWRAIERLAAAPSPTPWS